MCSLIVWHPGCIHGSRYCALTEDEWIIKHLNVSHLQTGVCSKIMAIYNRKSTRAKPFKTSTYNECIRYQQRLIIKWMLKGNSKVYLNEQKRNVVQNEFTTNVRLKNNKKKTCLAFLLRIIERNSRWQTSIVKEHAHLCLECGERYLLFSFHSYYFYWRRTLPNIPKCSDLIITSTTGLLTWRVASKTGTSCS